MDTQFYALLLEPEHAWICEWQMALMLGAIVLSHWMAAR